jgi:hypothetical protein
MKSKSSDVSVSIMSSNKLQMKNSKILNQLNAFSSKDKVVEEEIEDKPINQRVIPKTLQVSYRFDDEFLAHS